MLTQYIRYLDLKVLDLEFLILEIGEQKISINEDTAITTIEKIIDETPTRDLKILSVKRISNIIGRNEIAVRKIYKRKRDLHLSKLIFYKKIQKGYILLKSKPNLNIKDISNIVGYEKAEYFRKLIKKIFGKTPSEIRNDCKKD